MSLTKAQLEKVLEIIQRHQLAFTYEALGPRALTREEIRTLAAAGLLREGVRHMIADPIALGRLLALVPMSARRGVTYEQVVEAVRNVPLTQIEKTAVTYATEHAGTYIKGILDMTLRDTTAAASRAEGAALRAVQQGTANAITERKTIGEFKTWLFDTIDNRTRDFQRIAHTEINTAIQHGIAAALGEKGGGDQLVYKRPNPDACVHCKRLYLTSDGFTPRVFHLSSLDESNVGKRAHAWTAVVGSTHPWCNCQLLVIPEGFDFVKTRTVATPFTDDHGREWKRGEVVDEDDFGKLKAADQAKIGWDAVLGYTGTTATPTVEKSFIPYDGADDCSCDHD